MPYLVVNILTRSNTQWWSHKHESKWHQTWVGFIIAAVRLVGVLLWVERHWSKAQCRMFVVLNWNNKSKVSHQEDQSGITYCVITNIPQRHRILDSDWSEWCWFWFFYLFSRTAALRVVQLQIYINALVLINYCFYSNGSHGTCIVDVPRKQIIFIYI